MDEKVKIKIAKAGEQPVEASGPASVELSEVSVSNGEGRSLRAVHLGVAPGESVALTGPDAVGRSTILDLVAGRSNAASGFVAIDGVDVRDLRLDVIGDQVLLLRRSEIFAGTLLDNMRIVCPSASIDRVDHALASVGLLEEVRALPDGLQTRLVTHGAPLTLSQRTRLVLARAILARPRVLLIDGLLDRLDETSRKPALDVLCDSEAPWTLCVASERPDVLVRCDRVVRVEEGRIEGGGLERDRDRSPGGAP